MKYLSLTLFVVHSVFYRLAQGLSPTYINCQLEKSGQSPLDGCPDGTIYVSATDATYANFSSVQAAIDSLPSTGTAIVLVGKGNYSEMLNVKRSAPIVLLGQLDDQTGRNGAHNTVRIWNAKYTQDGVSDEDTATLNVFPTDGNTGVFSVYNIIFENLAANYDIAPALTTAFTYTNASFYGCIFASYQDTWYTGYESNTYVVDSRIYGKTDYLFGCGTGWFQSVTLANRGCGGGITAWRGSAGTQNGVYIADSNIIRSPDASVSEVTDKGCYLGRPWDDTAVAVFLRSYMDDSIHPARFTTWAGESSIPDTTFFAEYNSHGPGSDVSGRVSQDHILSDAEAAGYTLDNIFGPSPSWIDHAYQY